MIRLDDAINMVVEFANSKYQDNGKYIVDSENIIEKEQGWFIPFYLEGNESDRYKSWIGAYKGCIVTKKDKICIQPSSPYSLDDWFWILNIGYGKGKQDFVITKIYDFEKTVELLLELGFIYTIPEVENGTEWKIPRRFTKKMLEDRLSVLPAIFFNQGEVLSSIWDIKEVVSSKAFEFQLVPSRYEKRELGSGEWYTKIR